MRRRTITFDHEGFDDIVSDHFKVGVANPVTDGGLGSGEKVVKDGDFMAQEHQSVYQVGTDKTGTTSNEDTFTLGRREEFDRGKTGEGGV